MRGEQALVVEDVAPAHQCTETDDVDKIEALDQFAGIEPGGSAIDQRVTGEPGLPHPFENGILPDAHLADDALGVAVLVGVAIQLWFFLALTLDPFAIAAQALIGETIAHRYGWKAGDHIPLSSTIFSQKTGGHTWDMTIAGVVGAKNPQTDTNVLLFHYNYFNETRTFGKDSIGWIVINTDEPAINDQVAKAIDRLFVNSTAETSTESEKAFNKAFAAQFGNIALIVELVISAAFFTILLIVGNTMIMAVRERTREIAVLKTLGFGPWRILRLVLGETLLLVLLGGLPGLGLA